MTTACTTLDAAQQQLLAARDAIHAVRRDILKELATLPISDPAGERLDNCMAELRREENALCAKMEELESACEMQTGSETTAAAPPLPVLPVAETMALHPPLPPEVLEAIAKYHRAGLPVLRIARLLGISRYQVQKYISRA